MVLLAVKASRRKSRTLRIGLSPLPFLWTAVAGSIIIIVSVRNSYSSFLCYLACVSLSARLLHSPLPTLALKSPSTILFHGGYVQIAGNSQQEVIAPNRYSIQLADLYEVSIDYLLGRSAERRFNTLGFDPITVDIIEQVNQFSTAEKNTLEAPQALQCH